MAEKPFVRVTDSKTHHEFDIHRTTLDAAEKGRYVPVKDVEDSWSARPAKPAESKKTSSTSSESAKS